MMIKALALTALLACVSGASAGQEGQIYLNFGGVSYHPGDKAGMLNGINPGLGLEYHRAGGDFIAAGLYHNSIGRSSRYAVYAKQVMAKGGVSLGVFGGVVDGYQWRDGGFIPFAAPYLSITGDRAGVNLVFIPSVEKKVSSAIALQFKIRVF